MQKHVGGRRAAEEAAELVNVILSHPQPLPCTAGAGKLPSPFFSFASSPPAKLACEEPKIARPEGKKGEAPSCYRKPQQCGAWLWRQELAPGMWFARVPHTPSRTEPGAASSPAQGPCSELLHCNGANLFPLLSALVEITGSCNHYTCDSSVSPRGSFLSPPPVNSCWGLCSPWDPS